MRIFFVSFIFVLFSCAASGMEMQENSSKKKKWDLNQPLQPVDKEGFTPKLNRRNKEEVRDCEDFLCSLGLLTLACIGAIKED